MAKKTKTYKEFELWANKIMKDMQKILLSQDFNLSDIKKANHPDTSTSEYHYPYKEIHIEYSESVFTLWKNGDLRQASAVLLHEMIHPLTDKLYGVGYDRFITKQQIENEREQLTDHFANVIMRLTYDRNGNFK